MADDIFKFKVLKEDCCILIKISLDLFSRIQFTQVNLGLHDDVIELKHFPRYWHFVRGIHRSQVDSPHRGQ